MLRKKLDPKIVTWNFVLQRKWVDFKYSSDLKSTEYIRTVSRELDLCIWKSLFWWKDISIAALPCTCGFRLAKINGLPLWISVRNYSNWFHAFSLNNWSVSLKIVEHLLAIPWWLNIFFDLVVKWWNSIPNWVNWLTECLSEIYENIVTTDEKIRYFTVKEPIYLEYKNWSYIALYPDDWRKIITIDLMIDYENQDLWQRVVVDIDDEFFQTIAWARTNWHTTRLTTKLMMFAQLFPNYKPLSYRKLVNLWLDNVFVFSDTSVVNPKKQFMIWWKEMELVFHEVVDKLWAFWADFDSWARFVGKVVTNRSSHAMDIDMVQKLNDWQIPLVFND